jgi:surface antigen
MSIATSHDVIGPRTLRRHAVAFGLAGALLLAGCASSGPNERGGTAIGAGGGAIVGALVGGWQGAAIGAVAGGIVGNLIGRDMDDRERRRAEEASYAAAREDRRTYWGDRASTYGYTEPVGAYYARGGQTCHDYLQYMRKNGREYTDRITICRTPQGGFARG